MPIVQKKSTYYHKKAMIHKALKYEDVYRAVQKKEVENMLRDTYAEDEVIRLIEKYYGGSVTHSEFINYNPARIIKNFFFGSQKDVGKDHINEFE